MKFVNKMTWEEKHRNRGVPTVDNVPGEDFMRRKLKKFQDDMGKLTSANDCDAMAQIFEQAAAQFNPELLVNAVADTLTDYGKWFTGDEDFVKFHDSGFAKDYQESSTPDPNNPYWNNQVRHFAAGFILGYLTGLDPLSGPPGAWKILCPSRVITY